MMRPRHTPTLYPHAENDDGGGEQSWSSSAGVSNSPSASSLLSMNGSGGRYTRQSSNFSSMLTPKNRPNDSNIFYSEFIKIYRSGSEQGDRNDPDDNYFRRGHGHLLDDQGDSDVEDTSSSVNDGLLILEPEQAIPANDKEKERLTWQVYLAHVLGGDVLKSEKRRIADVLDAAKDDHSTTRTKLWLGIRAAMHGRTDAEEKKLLSAKRIRLVDPIIHDILNFKSTAPPGNATAAVEEVRQLLQRLDVAETLYTSLKAFHQDKLVTTEGPFRARVDALNTWLNVLSSVRHQVAILQHWTGSETLDVSQPNTSAEQPLADGSRKGELADSSSFVERVLKEESTQRMFEKGSLVTSYACVGAARDAQIELAEIFKEMNLPMFEAEITPLISFPTKLVQASLRVRLDYLGKLENPDALILDQMTEDIKLSIGLACTLKRQYEAFLAPGPDGKWNVADCISSNYDETILDATREFFKLLHWKLKSGKKIYIKETDVLEAQWPTMDDVSMTVNGGAFFIAEQLCSLTNRLMVRVINYFDTQVKVANDEGFGHKKSQSRRVANASVPESSAMRTAFQEQMHEDSVASMTDQEKVAWYGKILDGVRVRYRKLQRFARTLTQRFSNSAEYALDVDEEFDTFGQMIERLVATDHFLVYTDSYEADGIYIIASPSLRETPDTINKILGRAFHVSDISVDDGIRVEMEGSDLEDPKYIIILYPSHSWFWRGATVKHSIPEKPDLDLKDDRIRLVADGPLRRLALAKRQFATIVDGFAEYEPILACVVEQQAHLPQVNRELRKIVRSTMRLAESIVKSVHHVRQSMEVSNGCQELMQSWYQFASEHGQHALKYMDRAYVLRFNQLLVKLAISWLSFVCDDCDPDDRMTFKWAVNALEFTFQRTKRNILSLTDDQFYTLRRKVGSCIGFLTIHFDILGARTSLQASKVQEEVGRQIVDSKVEVEDASLFTDTTGLPLPDATIAPFWDRIEQSCQELDELRAEVGPDYRLLGRVLDNSKPEDRSLLSLAASSSNIAIRWQQGRFIGAGAFGSVYLAVNLDSGSLMAVKEIKFQEMTGKNNLYAQIKDELEVMERLHHPNIVEYYGIEVHRDKVYIFEEYCQGGSLASLLEFGRIEDEGIIQLYALQMLEGLNYLHSRDIAHRDIKPDNILLDHSGVIKFVDFGAAKILAKNQRSVQRSRRSDGVSAVPGAKVFDADGLAVNNSLTGTPMYMSPEIIRNDKRGRKGAMDIWSLGCVILECATGRKPWSNLDNEWAIMFRIGVATQHPPLPEPGQLSSLGIHFIKKCLTIDPMLRPSAQELLDTDPWMIDFREQVESISATQQGDLEVSLDESYEQATVARQAAILHEQEIEHIREPSPPPESEPEMTPV